MHTDSQHSIIPLERYRDLIAALQSENDLWQESFWLRFAAQAGVFVPDAPEMIAKRIRATAHTLHHQAAWYQTLAGPARFVVAAMLIQHGIPVAEFVHEHNRVAAMLNEVGLKHGRFHEVVAVVILMTWPGSRGPTMIEIGRVKAIYERMKRYHGWIAGIQDLPACAALAQCPESCEVVAGRCEAIFQQLHGAGLPSGQRLLTAANVLALSGLTADKAVERYLRLAWTMFEQTGRPREDHYDPLALLTLLDHEPEVVVARWTAVNHELDLFQPDERGEANDIIAADLTFLDLMRFDRAMVPITQPTAAGSMLGSFHAYHLASAILVSQVEPHLVMPDGMPGHPFWPYL